MDTNNNRFVSTMNVAFKNIAEYLNHRDLLSLYNTSAQLRSIEYWSIELVVKIGMYSGNLDTKTTIEHLNQCIQKYHIHMPSIQRLLNLINIKKCEICKTKKVRYCSRFGIAFCCSCRNRYTTIIKCVAPRYLHAGVARNDIIQHSGVCAIIHHLARESYHSHSPRHPAFMILKSPLYGEDGYRIGPIITKQNFDEMLSLQNYSDLNGYITTRINNAYPTNYEILRQQYINTVCNHRQPAWNVRYLRVSGVRERVRQFRTRKQQQAKRALDRIIAMIPPQLRHVMIYELDDQYPVHLPPRYMPSRTPFQRGYCIHVYNMRARVIIKPVLTNPSRFLMSHAQRLFYARLICQEFHAVPNVHYEATQI